MKILKPKCRLIFVLAISLITNEAHARSFVPFTIDRLISASDLILTGKVSDIEVHVSTAFVMTRQANVTKAFATVDPVRIFHSTNTLARPIIVAYQDSDYFSGPSAPGRASQPYRIDQTYLLFLKKGAEGYHALQLYQGIAPINGSTVSLYIGAVDRSLIERYLELRIASTTTAKQWESFGAELITQADLNEGERTGAVFQMLFSLPNPNQYEPILIKGLDSQNSRVVFDCMRRLAAIGTEQGITAIVDLYFRIKKTGGWQKYTPQYVLPYEFNSILRDSKAREIVLRQKKRYPDERELFKEIN